MNDANIAKVLRWWQAMMLSDDKLQKLHIRSAPSSYRAQLRRCNSPDTAMMTEAFRSLWAALDRSDAYFKKTYAIESMAVIACVLAHVEEDGQCFATAAGKKEQGDKAVVSELRFAQLQDSQSAEEFSRRLRRMIQQLKGKVAVAALAKDITAWFNEKNELRPRAAGSCVAVRWAMDYYA